ncbi:MAG TPA: hypothetical protein VE974_01560 [Thermoanaerobaculia bacterium]|nr:hypothetical protein [Thermoanaerobaculia bacterium]
MNVPFHQFNAELLEILGSDRERIERKSLLAAQEARLAKEGGHRLHMLPVNFVFDERDRDQLAEAAAAFVAVQTKILRHFAATVGREGILQTFRVPAAMQRFVNWNELLEPECLVARFDILQSRDGYHFCEFNIDSCVAAAEIFEFAGTYFDELGVGVQDRLGLTPPLKNLGAYIAQLARKRDAARIVILDWSTDGGSAGKGYLSFDRVRGHLQREAAPLPVFIADEKTYDPAWLSEAEARRTLVFRGFMMDEMDDGGAFLDLLIAQGTPVFNTYESELRMNKVWFALLHYEALQSILTPRERALIAKYIPYTCEIDGGNVESLIERRSEYVFKEKQSFGGKGIHVGDETPVEELRAILSGERMRDWTAQQLLHALPATFPHDERFDSEPHNLVFGMYLYGSNAAGMLVRGSTRSRVVNVTVGNAKLAWAFSVSEAARAALVSGLAEAQRAGH